jgi:drug/metabolite transporter (DMT)-like permease
LKQPRKGAGVGRSNTSVHLLLLLMVAIWGINIPVSKYTLVDMPPLAFTCLRAVLCQVALVAYQLVRREPIWVRRKDSLRLLVVGLTGSAMYQLFFILGVARTSANKASLILAAVPVMVAIMGTVMGVEKLGARGWIGALACFIGIVIVSIAGGLDLRQGGWLGDALMLISALGWAISTVVSRPLFETYSSGVVTTGSMMIGAIVFVPLAIPSLLKLDWGAVSWAGWSGILYTAFLASAVANVLYNIGVKRIGGARTTVYNNVTPLFAIASAWILLGERFSFVQALGAIVIFVGLRLTQTDRAPAPRVLQPVAFRAGGDGGAGQ